MHGYEFIISILNYLSIEKGALYRPHVRFSEDLPFKVPPRSDTDNMHFKLCGRLCLNGNLLSRLPVKYS